MSTLTDRAAELVVAAQRVAKRTAAAADASALSDALTTFEHHRETLRPVASRARAMRDHGIAVAFPTNGPRIAEELRALAANINDDPTAVRNRRPTVDLVDTFVSVVQQDVEAELREYVTTARGTADLGLVPSLRLIGLGDAAMSVAAALETLHGFESKLPATTADLREVKSASDRIQTVFAEMKTPENAPLVEFMEKVARGAIVLDDITPALLERLQSSGVAANFVVRARGQV